MRYDDSNRGLSLDERLEQRGINRREFLSFTAKIAAVMGMTPAFGTEIACALTSDTRPSVIYLNLAECTGCTEALLRTESPTFTEVILDIISLDYSETLMAAAGDAAERALRQTMADPRGYLCIVEGAIPTANDGHFGHAGGRTLLELAKEVTAGAKAVIAYGACANYGGVQAAAPNPTGAKGVGDALEGIRPINVAGCPPNPINLVGTLAHLISLGPPQLDAQGRPVRFYGRTVHDQCDRLEHFYAGRFAPALDSPEARRGWCLYTLGCKGPYAHNNCPTQLFNQTSWPVKAGHPCIGCSEPRFWDELAPIYEPVGTREAPSSDSGSTAEPDLATTAASPPEGARRG